MIFVLFDAIKITEPFFSDASYNQIGNLDTLMVGVCNGRRDTCIPLCTLLLPLPTTTPTPPNTYHYPYSSPCLLPWVPPAFLEGWGQDRVRGHHLTAKYSYRGVVRFRPIQPGGGGGGGGGAHVASNTEYFIRSGGPPGDAHDLLPDEIPAYMYPYVPYSSPYLLLPLLLPLPTTTPTPPFTYYYPYSTPYLLLPLLLPLPTTTPTPPLTYYYPYSSPYLLCIYPYSSPYLLLYSTPPLTYYFPGAWSEVTSMVTYMMMTNSLIHYCQREKHIYMDTF